MERNFHIDRQAGMLAAVGRSGDPTQLLSTPELAQWLGRSPQWLELMRARGGGPPFVKVSRRCVRYRRSAVLQWLLEREHTRTVASSPSSSTTKQAKPAPRPATDR